MIETGTMYKTVLRLYYFIGKYKAFHNIIGTFHKLYDIKAFNMLGVAYIDNFFMKTLLVLWFKTTNVYNI